MRPAPKVHIKERFIGYEKCAICGGDIEIWIDQFEEKNLTFAFHNRTAYIQRNVLIHECVQKQKRESKMREGYESLKRKGLA